MLWGLRLQYLQLKDLCQLPKQLQPIAHQFNSRCATGSITSTNLAGNGLSETSQYMTSRASDEGKLTCLSSSLGWHCVTIEVQELSWTGKRRQKKDAHVAQGSSLYLIFHRSEWGSCNPRGHQFMEITGV